MSFFGLTWLNRHDSLRLLLRGTLTRHSQCSRVMHVDRIPNRTSPPAFLLRETYREDGKVKKRTLANITQWPVAKIEALRRLLRDEYAPHEPRADLKLMRSLPHGHVAAALGMLRKLGLDDLLAEGQRQRARMVALVTALVVARLLDPASKLTTARLLDGTTATSSLGTVLALGKVDEQELYDALDWLLAQQERIETALARRHLGALRREFNLFRRADLRTGQIRP